MSLHNTVHPCAEQAASADIIRTQVDKKSRYSCRFSVLSLALKRDRRITPADKLILMTLQDYGFGVDFCYPSVQTIAEDSGVSVRKAQLSLKALADLGMIRIDPDPTNATGRRIVRLWMSDPDLHPVEGAAPSPDPDLGRKKCTAPPAKSAATPRRICTPALGAENADNSTLLSQPHETTTKNSSSSFSSLAHVGGEGTEPDDVSATDDRVTEAVVLAVELWPDDPHATATSRASALCQDYGPVVALAALQEARKCGKPIEWRYLLGIAKKLDKEGLPLGKSRPTPKPASSPRVPVVPASTPEPGDDEKWAKWFNGQAADVRFKFGQADETKRKAVRDKVVNARSPDAVLDKVRVMLDLAVPPELAALKPTRPIVRSVEPERPSDEELAAMAGLPWMDAV